MMNYKMLAGVAAVACSAVLVGCGGQSKPPGPDYRANAVNACKTLVAATSLVATGVYGLARPSGFTARSSRTS